jgi:hypothetical protein
VISCLHDYLSTETLAPERSYRITSKSVPLVSETSPALEPVIFTDVLLKVVESVGHRRTWAYLSSRLQGVRSSLECPGIPTPAKIRDEFWSFLGRDGYPTCLHSLSLPGKISSLYGSFWQEIRKRAKER